MFKPIPRDKSRGLCHGCCFLAPVVNTCTLRDNVKPIALMTACEWCDTLLRNHGVPAGTVDDWIWASAEHSTLED